MDKCSVLLSSALHDLYCPCQVDGAPRVHYVDLKPCFATFWLTFQNALQAGFTSLAHTDADVEHTIQAARETFAEI